jgi:uncharacterized protein YciI
VTIPDLTPLVVSQLIRADDAPDLPEPELQRLQYEHVEWVESLRERGLVIAAGPWMGHSDERVRGLILWTGEVDQDAARALAAEDPVVRAGRTRHEVFTWLTATASPVVSLV